MREAAPWRAALDFPIGELQVLDDRVRDHVAFGISQRSARAAIGVPDHRNEKGTRSTVEAMICGSVVEGVHHPLAEPGEFQGLAGRSWRAVVCGSKSMWSD
jgi:hypothetical protein